MERSIRTLTWPMIKVWLAAGEIGEIEAVSGTFILEASKKCGNLPARRKQAATDKKKSIKQC